MGFGRSFFGVLPFGSFKRKKVELPDVEYDYDIEIQIIYKNGWIKKTIIPGHPTCNLTSWDCEITEKGPASGKLVFASLDFSIYTGDIIIIYYQGKKIFKGFVLELPIPGKNSVLLSSQREMLMRIVYEGSFTNVAIVDMLKTIIQEKQDITGVSWHDDYISDEFRNKDTELISIDYICDDIENIIKKYVEKVDPDAVPGVNLDDIFYVSYPKTSVSLCLSYENNDYINIEEKPNTRSYKATRYYVTIKGDPAGRVGFEDTLDYPSLLIEDRIGRIEKKLNISEDIDSTTACDLAYNKLLSQSANDTLKLSNIDMKHNIKTLQKIQVLGKELKRAFTIIDCESSNGWFLDFSVDSLVKLKGNNSIKINSEAFYSYSYNEHIGKFFRIKNLEKINLVVKSSVFQTIEITFYTENEIIKYFKKEILTTEWFLIQIDLDKDFQFIKFICDNTIYIDEIEAVGDFFYIYQDYIKQINFKGNSDGTVECDAVLSNYDYKKNDKFFELENKIKSLE